MERFLLFFFFFFFHAFPRERSKRRDRSLSDLFASREPVEYKQHPRVSLALGR